MVDIILSDDMVHLQRVYSAQNNAWSKWSDPPVTDFTGTICIEPDSFPAKTLISWRFPDEARNGVYGYPHIAWGQYFRDKPPLMQPPRQVKDINFFDFAYGIRLLDSIKGQGANLLVNMFLTREKSNIDSKAYEIGFMLHAPISQRQWAESTYPNGRYLGRFNSRGNHDWDVYEQDGGSQTRYALIFPVEGSVFAGTVDALAAIRFLLAKKIITPDLWLNGLAIGPEPVRGFGCAVVDKFQVNIY